MAKQGKPVRLSKSKFMAGLQCLKRLYWLVHEPELAPALDEATLAVLKQGHEVGQVAQKAFPGGVAVQGEHWEVQNALRQTAELMCNPEIPAIFEAAFVHDGILVRVDILQRREPKRWRLIEVKAAGSLKDEHIPDVAIQKHVVEGAGVSLDAAELMHLNMDYVYDGRLLLVKKLFSQANVTQGASDFQGSIPALLCQQRNALQGAKAPDVQPGPRCMAPRKCEFYSLCNKELPADHVSFIPGLRQNRINQLLDMGITSMKKVPADFRLNDVQRRACDCLRSGNPYFSDPIAKELSGLTYPLFYMDFETYNPAIPRYAGMCPFGIIPFQWSVHVQKKPGGKLEHHEFLSDDGSDPREAFIVTLLEVLEEDPAGQIVCYSSYEPTQLKHLAEWLPRYVRRIEKVHSRLWDLFKFIKAHVYHRDFRRSFSLKQVLPALLPEMSYEGMDIADGTQAGIAYNTLVRGELPLAERRKLREALLAYCGQDTLAMVRLVERLRST